MHIPDESYYGTLGKIKDIDTLSHQSQIVHQNLSKDTLHGHCARMSLWGYHECKGQLIHSICNVAVEDLPALRRGYGDALEEGCFIGNKFKLSVDAPAVACQMLHILESYGINKAAWSSSMESELTNI